MSFIAAAVIGGATLSAGANIYASNKASSAASKGAKASERIQLAQLEESTRRYEQAREDQAPYRQVGTGALNQLAAMYGVPQHVPAVIDEATGDVIEPATTSQQAAPDYSAFYESPDYQFAYDQGMRAVQQSLAQRGLGGAGQSGAAMKELARFGSGLASQQFGNYRNSLQALAGIGQTSTAQSGQLASGMNQSAGTTAARIGGTRMAAGDARASSYLNQASAINQLSNTGMDLAVLNKMGYI